jgi:ATP-dependent DNA helicase DinG
MLHRARRRASEGADLVIANHALVMLLGARRAERGSRLARIVFDEGHHLFDAADSTFAAALTGQEAIELRRWIVGPESKARGRRRGLSARLLDVASYDEEGASRDRAGVGGGARAACRRLARAAGEESAARADRDAARGASARHVYARASAADAGYGLETHAAELDAPLIEAEPAIEALEALMRPLARLRQRLRR